MTTDTHDTPAARYYVRDCKRRTSYHDTLAEALAAARRGMPLDRLTLDNGRADLDRTGTAWFSAGSRDALVVDTEHKALAGKPANTQQEKETTT